MAPPAVAAETGTESVARARTGTRHGLYVLLSVVLWAVHLQRVLPKQGDVPIAVQCVLAGMRMRVRRAGVGGPATSGSPTQILSMTRGMIEATASVGDEGNVAGIPSAAYVPLSE